MMTYSNIFREEHLKEKKKPGKTQKYDSFPAIA